ncbi:MAG: hypothetical protein AAF628_37065 [Planctomycetota bacterium]
MDDRHRALIHLVNNLLGSIRVQAALARQLGTAEAAQEALAVVERAAQRAEADVASLRRGETEPGTSGEG